MAAVTTRLAFIGMLIIAQVGLKTTPAEARVKSSFNISSLVGVWQGECSSGEQISYHFRSAESGAIYYASSLDENCSGAVKSLSVTDFIYKVTSISNDTFTISFRVQNPRKGDPTGFIYRLNAPNVNSGFLEPLAWTTSEAGHDLRHTFPAGTKGTAVTKVSVAPSLEETVAKALPYLSINKTVRALSDIKTLTNLPSISGSIYPHPAEPSSTQLSTPILGLQEQMNLEFFGRPNVLTVYAAQNPGNAQCYPQLKTIGFDPDMANQWKLSDEEMQHHSAFVLAHESAHFVHELYLLKISGDGLSPNGLRSIYEPDSPVTKLSPSEARKTRLAEAIRYAQEHAEVDAIAITALEDMGFSKREIGQDIQKNFDLETQDLPVHSANIPMELIPTEMTAPLFDAWIRFKSNQVFLGR